MIPPFIGSPVRKFTDTVLPLFPSFSWINSVKQLLWSFPKAFSISKSCQYSTFISKLHGRVFTFSFLKPCLYFVLEIPTQPPLLYFHFHFKHWRSWDSNSNFFSSLPMLKLLISSQNLIMLLWWLDQNDVSIPELLLSCESFLWFHWLLHRYIKF